MHGGFCKMSSWECGFRAHVQSMCTPFLWCREFLGDPTVSWALPGLSSPRAALLKPGAREAGHFGTQNSPFRCIFFFFYRGFGSPVNRNWEALVGRATLGACQTRTDTRPG